MDEALLTGMTTDILSLEVSYISEGVQKNCTVKTHMWFYDSIFLLFFSKSPLT